MLCCLFRHDSQVRTWQGKKPADGAGATGSSRRHFGRAGRAHLSSPLQAGACLLSDPCTLLRDLSGPNIAPRRSAPSHSPCPKAQPFPRAPSMQKMILYLTRLKTRNGVARRTRWVNCAGRWLTKHRKLKVHPAALPPGCGGPSGVRRARNGMPCSIPTERSAQAVRAMIFYA